MTTRKTERMLLTPPTSDDFQGYLALHRDERVMATLGGVQADPKWTQEMLQRLVSHWQSFGFGWWTLREPSSGQFLGRGGLQILMVEGEPMVEVGYAIIVERWRQGLATELSTHALQFGFNELDIKQIVSLTMEANLAAQGVMEKCGLKHLRSFQRADLPHVLFGISAAEFAAQS